MKTTKHDVSELSFHCDGGAGHFAVNVKYHGTENYGSLSEEDRQAAYTWAVESFWCDLRTLAEETFGKEYTVYSEGRSGGWAVPAKKIVDGRVTPETRGFTVEQIEESKDLLAKCIRFRAAVKQMLLGAGHTYLGPIVRDMIEQRDEKAKAKRHEAEVILSALATARALVDWKYANDPAVLPIEEKFRKRLAK